MPKRLHSNGISLPPRSKSQQSNFFEKRTKDKMSPLHVPNMRFSILKSSKNTKVAKGKISRIKFEGIDFVWENGSDMQIGNWNRKNMQGVYYSSLSWA